MAFVNQRPWRVRVLQSLAPFGRAYVRFRLSECWFCYELGSLCFDASMLYRKWRSVPKFVEMLQSEDIMVRFQGALELERMSLRYTRTRFFSMSSVEHGSIPGLLSMLDSETPSAVSAALCVLCDVYGHPKCVERLDNGVLNTIFMLTSAEDLFCRLRASLFLALLTTEASMEEKLQSAVCSDPLYLRQVTSLIRKPLPDRFQNILDNPPQINGPTHHLRMFKGQLRKAAVTILFLVLQSEHLLDDMEYRGLSHIVRAVRDKDAGLRTACQGCLKIIAKREEGRRMIGDCAARYWTYLTPKRRDLDCVALIEELGVYPDLRDRFVKDGFFLHRLPGLIASGKNETKVTAFRSLFPFTQSTPHRWKVVKSGLLHLIIDGLYNNNKSVYIAAIICLAQLSVSQEVFLAIQAEFSERKSIPPKVGEYLIYLALCYPDEDLGKGGVRLLQEVVPRLKSLPRDVLKKLASSLVDKDVQCQAGSARLISHIGRVEKFRNTLLQSSIVTDILLQMKSGPSQCKAAMVQALSTLSEDAQTAKKISNVRGLKEALWRSQEGRDEDLAISALDLLRVLSKSVDLSFTNMMVSLPKGC